MSILTEDGIYNDTYIDCTIVKDNIISLLIHDKKNSVTRSYKFESVEKAEELANKLLQVIFTLTEKKVDYKKIFTTLYEVILSKQNLTNDEIYFLSLIKFRKHVYDDIDGSILLFYFCTPELVIKNQKHVFARRMNVFFKKIHDNILSVYLDNGVYASGAFLSRVEL
jgi:hypothetical protein